MEFNYAFSYSRSSCVTSLQHNRTELPQTSREEAPRHMSTNHKHLGACRRFVLAEATPAPCAPCPGGASPAGGGAGAHRGRSRSPRLGLPGLRVRGYADPKANPEPPRDSARLCNSPAAGPGCGKRR